MDIKDIRIGDRLVVREDLVFGAIYGSLGVEDPSKYGGQWCRVIDKIMDLQGEEVTVVEIDKGFYIGVEQLMEAGRVRYWLSPSMIACHADHRDHESALIDEKDLVDLLGW